jgi:hypothetical protein
LSGILQHGAQVLEIDEQESVVVGDLEDQTEDPALDVIEFEQTAEQQRPHLGDGASRRVPLLAEDVPESDRATLPLPGFFADPQHLQPLSDLGIFPARLADAGQIPLDVGHEDRHPAAAEVFGQHLHGNGLTGSGGSGDQAVAVGHLRQQIQIFITITSGNNKRFGHGAPRF